MTVTPKKQGKKIEEIPTCALVRSIREDLEHERQKLEKEAEKKQRQKSKR